MSNAWVTVCRSRLILVPALLAGLALSGLAAETNENVSALEPAREKMRAKAYDRAVKELDGVLATKPAQPAEAHYLKALALFYSKAYEDAEKSADTVIGQFADSAWYHKALFLKARCLTEQRKFKDAEAIYEQEANRLLSDARKHEIAGMIVTFADELSTEPARDALDAPPPDYNKAYNLYGKVLDMQIRRTLRDEVLFKRAWAIQKAGNFSQAAVEFGNYLREFDPEWTGTAGGNPPRMKQENPPPPGKQRMAARYHLAESLLKSGDAAQARRELEDLVRTVGAGENLPAGFLADVHWLLVRTYGFPSPAAHEREQAVKAARHFLELFPKDRRAVRLAFEIGEAYRTAGRSDAAIQAYRDFIEGKGFGLPDGAAAMEKDPETTRSPAEFKDESDRAAVYYIGSILFSQAKYSDAIAQWQDYVTRFPNGPHWATCQEGIINAEYQRAMQAMSEKRHDEARALFDAFLVAHPLDARSRQILFTFGQTHYARAQDMEEKKASSDDIRAAFKSAIDEWARLISKYPNTEESSLALYRTGQVYEEKLGDLEKALESYRRLTWGSYAGQAQQRIAIMTQKELTLNTRRKYRSRETAKVTLKTRNIEKVTLKLYTLDLEAFFRKTHGTGGVEDLDISLIQPDRTTEIKIDGYAKYKPIEREIEIPFDPGKPGVCVVNVSEEDWDATTLVIRSDLDLVAKSSRREVLVFVEDMVSKEAAEGVKVLLSDGKTIFASGATGKDGVFKQACDELKSVSDIRVFASRNGHTAAQNLDIGNLRMNSGLTPKGYIYADRSVYKPGGTVSVRGILRDVRDGAYAVPDVGEFAVSVIDAKGRLIREEKRRLSEFGTFNMSFDLPAAAPEGAYTVSARAERKNREPLSFSGSFMVRDFKPEKIRLTVDFPRSVYFRGEIVEAEVKAEYYWGEPAEGKPVRYTLPDGRSFAATTDENGKLKFSYDTASMLPGRPLAFQVNLEGENVSAGGTVMLVMLGFDLGVQASQDTVLSGEPVDVTVRATAADGKPAAQEVTLTILRKAEAEPDPVLKMIPWGRPPAPPPAETTVQEFKLKTDPKTGIAVQTVKIGKGGAYLLRASGLDQFGQTVTGESRVQISGAEDAVKLRLFAESSRLQVGRHADLRLHSRMADGLALVTHEGEEILRHRIVEIREGYTDIGFDVGHEHFPNFRVAVAVMDGSELRTANKDFTVERELRVTAKPLKSAYLPGEEGKVELTVTDQLGKPVRAELSLALVDEGVFAVMADRTPAILDFFQREARRHAEFQTASTCGFRYDGVTRRVIKEILEEGQRVVRERREAEELAKLRSEDRKKAEAPRSGARRGRQAADYAMGVDKESKSEEMNAPADASGLASGEAGELVALDRLDESQPAGVIMMKSLYAARSIGGRKSALRAYTGGGAAAAEVRREIPEEGRWFPAVVTDQAGKAVVTVPMPSKTTEWRLTARGCSVETLVGEARTNTLTRKDFFVDLKMPATVQEGDGIRVLARVHNLTDYAGPVELRLSVKGKGKAATNLAARTQTVQVKAKGGAEIAFEPIEIPGIVSLNVTVEARAGDLADALALDVPVRLYGIEYASHGGGVATADAGLVLQLPDQKYSSQWMVISVGPSLKQSVVDLALSDVIPFQEISLRTPICPPPWGGTDGSELLAKASGMEYARRTAAPDLDVQRLTESARGLVSALIASQRDDGGWAWQGRNSGSDWAPSARAFWALVQARDLGIPVYTDTVAKAQVFLQNSFQSFGATDNDAKAVVLHALSVNKAADFANCNRLHRDRNSMGSAALAYLALAFLNLDRPDFAKELLDILETKGEPSAGQDKRTLSWDPKAPHAWMQDRTETTALVLLAFSKGRPASPIAKAAAEYLLDAKGCYGISPAKARGPVVAALAAWFGQGQRADTDFRIAVQVNGQPVTNIVARGPQTTLYTSVPPGLLKDGKNLVEFKMEGRGEYAYAATLRGFSPELKDPGSWGCPIAKERHYYHSQLEYRGRPIGVNSTSPVSKLENGQRTDVLVHMWNTACRLNRYIVVEEPLPAGATVVEGSVSGNFSSFEMGLSRILFYYTPNSVMGDIRYQLVSYAPGTYRVLPTVMRDAVNPGAMRLGTASGLTALAPGEKTPDPFQMNNDELFALGRLCFEDGVYDKALENLTELFKRDRTYNEQEVARMLLWVHTMPAYYDARKIVEMFEILRERYPQLEIPFDKILVVGNAYRDIGEFERSCLVFRATIGASFVSDSSVSAILQDEGRLLGSIDYQERLWREYPDTAEVASSWFALAQTLFQKAPDADKLPKEGGRVPEKIAMLRRAADMLNMFLMLYPEDPLADDAAFSLCNTSLDLKDYERLVGLSLVFGERYTNSTMASSFQYMTALGQFWQSRYPEALAAARVVADGDSADRDLARYIVGQVYHAEGKPADAIDWYRKVCEKYADAAQAIAYFEEKRVALDEVSIMRPGEPVDLDIKYRNIREAFLQVYRVDLMKLYLREKNLSNITRVRLAGIKPEVEMTLPLGDGKDYVEKEKKARLPLKAEGAYLVICRGDDLFASGLVLVTPLKMEVQQDAQSGQVRANVLDAVKGGYRAGVHVKAIGSADKEFKSGETDLRGICVADGLRGKATVIAREGEARYAFYRGEQWLGAPAEQPAPPTLAPQQPGQQGQQLDYQLNLRESQQGIQGKNIQLFDQMRRQKQSGVQVQQAF